MDAPSHLEDVVLDLVATELNLDRSLLTAQVTVEELGADSLDVLKLTHAVEKKFKLSLAQYSHTDVSSIESLLEILRRELHREGGR